MQFLALCHKSKQLALSKEIHSLAFCKNYTGKFRPNWRAHHGKLRSSFLINSHSSRIPRVPLDHPAWLRQRLRCSMKSGINSKFNFIVSLDVVCTVYLLPFTFYLLYFDSRFSHSVNRHSPEVLEINGDRIRYVISLKLTRSSRICFSCVVTASFSSNSFIFAFTLEPLRKIQTEMDFQLIRSLSKSLTVN